MEPDADAGASALHRCRCDPNPSARGAGADRAGRFSAACGPTPDLVAGQSGSEAPPRATARIAVKAARPALQSASSTMHCYDPSSRDFASRGDPRAGWGDATDRRRQKLYDALVASGVAPSTSSSCTKYSSCTTVRLRDHGLDSLARRADARLRQRPQPDGAPRPGATPEGRNALTDPGTRGQGADQACGCGRQAARCSTPPQLRLPALRRKMGPCSSARRAGWSGQECLRPDD